jgi:hypothetical protein
MVKLYIFLIKGQKYILKKKDLDYRLNRVQ